jgi:hypothetical protein
MTSARLAATLALLFTSLAPHASAQSVDEILDKSIAALGGRAALGKIKTRHTTGNIVLSTPAGDINGSLEVWNAAPNKSRTLIKADLSALGAGPLEIDQRFDGHSGYVLDSLQGNREMGSNQADNLRNNSFPHPFLNYKDMGVAAKLVGKEKVGDRDAFVIVFDPTSGSEIRQFIDAETYMPVKMMSKVDIPQLGQEIEQTTEFLDYKDVDGIKLPFRIKASSSIQSITITTSKVEHNVAVDETMFSKPTK